MRLHTSNEQRQGTGQTPAPARLSWSLRAAGGMRAFCSGSRVRPDSSTSVTWLPTASCSLQRASSSASRCGSPSAPLLATALWPTPILLSHTCLTVPCTSPHTKPTRLEGGPLQARYPCEPCCGVEGLARPLCMSCPACWPTSARAIVTQPPAAHPCMELPCAYPHPTKLRLPTRPLKHPQPTRCLHIPSSTCNCMYEPACP